MSLEASVLITLAYTSQFHFPLTTREVYLRLIEQSKKVTSLEVANSLFILQKRGLIGYGDGYWFLSNHSNDILVREQRLAYSSQKIQELQPFITFSRRIHWISGLALTGSLSMNNAKKHDDVDLMVVCKQNRLWLVRPILLLYSQVKGKRRKRVGKTDNSWCLNLWLENETLRQLPEMRSLYVAYEVCQARWLYSTNYTSSLFYDLNKWVEQRVPNLFVNAQKTYSLDNSKLQDDLSLVVPFFDLMNYIFFLIQLTYMKKNITKEIISLHKAAFHPRDTRASIYKSIKEELQSLIGLTN